MQIDPRTMGQLIKSQMANSIDLQGTSVGTTSSDKGESLFDILLKELMISEGQDAESTLRNELQGGLTSEMMTEEMWQMLQSFGETELSGNINMLDMNTSASIPTGASKDIDELVSRASQTYGVPESLIKAVIETESSFNASTVSSAGAKGLMQLMDGTARGLGVSDSFDPAQNIDGGTRYLSYQLQRFNGNEKTALAAYNAGPGRVQRLGITNDQQLMEKLDLLPQETQNYIRKIELARTKYGD
ncbi:lytic transglycosylase domain-containing protein [Paenibacillus anaericanus]|uniref:Lytic transglycosylase domain-containing protein n=1 Tax=Paenibacillus anaericanus TaxID=170367 RepID=A0A433YDL0_9BACL|nr:lytic transglycosylase domain-containing protein [Paenibacillus anaericanus]RUT47962.1 lytic transglycosylase domain-containing protein [Paenibacillus anaericanus]